MALSKQVIQSFTVVASFLVVADICAVAPLSAVVATQVFVLLPRPLLASSCLVPCDVRILPGAPHAQQKQTIR